SLRTHHALRRNLATTGAVEDDPHGEVLGKVLEAMLGSRSHEQEIARPERVPLAVMKEDAAAADDNVNLVLGVRRRRPRERRKATEREHGLQGAALQKADGVLARRAGNTRLGLGKADDLATGRLAHASLSPPGHPPAVRPRAGTNTRRSRGAARPGP